MSVTQGVRDGGGQRKRVQVNKTNSDRVKERWVPRETHLYNMFAVL